MKYNIFYTPGKGDVVFIQFTITLSIYLVSILGINMLAPKLIADKSIESLKQTINSLKANEEVFKALLKKQPYYETHDCDSIIRFGNANSKLRITVLSNLYCNPCAKMHKRIEELLKKINNDISVQYILSSFEERLNLTNKYLIAAFLANEPCFALQVLNNWFEKGKELREDFFKEMGLGLENPEIEVEFQKHEMWKKNTLIKGTPTVLVNDYKLPDSYKIEDLHYFIDLDL